MQPQGLERGAAAADRSAHARAPGAVIATRCVAGTMAGPRIHCTSPVSGRFAHGAERHVFAVDENLGQAFTSTRRS